MHEACLSDGLDAAWTLVVTILSITAPTQQLDHARKQTSLQRVHGVTLQARDLPPYGIATKLPKSMRNTYIQCPIKCSDMEDIAINPQATPLLRPQTHHHIQHARCLRPA